MHQSAQQWQQNWSQQWAQHPKPWVGMGFTLEILKWVKLLCLGLGIFAVYSLVTHGHAYGVSMPGGLPVWIGIIAIVIIYKIVTWPIKAMRYGYYYRGMHPSCCGAGPLGGVLWLGFLVVAIWCLDRYVPGFHEGLKQIPPLLHQAVDSVQNWLDRA